MATRDEAKEQIRAAGERLIGDYLQPAKKKASDGRPTWICPDPECNNGDSGGDGDGISLDPKGTKAGGAPKWKCFKCGQERDIIDICMETTGADYNAALYELAAKLGIAIDGHSNGTQSKAPEEPAKEPVKESQGAAPAADFMRYYELCQKRLTDPLPAAYLTGRKISWLTAKKAGLGFDPNHNPPCIVVPCTRSYYVARALAGDWKGNPKGQAVDILGGRQLSEGIDQERLYICEGWADALSVIEAGGRAIALNSANNEGKLIERVKRQMEEDPGKLPRCFMLLLDNDEAGERCRDKLKAALDGLGLCWEVSEAASGYKDPNAALVSNESFFKGVITDERMRPLKEKEPEEDDDGADIDEFIKTVFDAKLRLYEPIKTGIPDIDEALGGGFSRKELITLGAPPAMGKTALAMWILEGIARQGAADVLYINLEMGKHHLIARSLSRFIYENNAVDFTVDEILRAYSLEEEGGPGYDPIRAAYIRAAAEDYKKAIAPHMRYNPKVKGATAPGSDISTIMQAIEAETARLKKRGRKAPLVCVDYLQFILNAGSRDAAEGIKESLQKLKSWAVDNGGVVLLIVANNRESNKSGTVTMESGRDTSAIEYTADCMLGLAYTAVEEERKINPETGEPAANGEKSEAATLTIIRRLRRMAFDKREPGKPVEVPFVCNEISLNLLKGRFSLADSRAKLVFDGRHSTFRTLSREEAEGYRPLMGITTPYTQEAQGAGNAQQANKGSGSRTGR